MTRTGCLSQLKSGRTSAPRLPQCLADKARPRVAADGDRVAAAVVGANSGAVVGRALSPMQIVFRPSSIVADDTNPLEEIFRFHAEKFRAAPGAARVARLAKTAARIPEPLLYDLATLITQLDDVQLVGNDIAIHLIEVGFCDARYADAVEFASALKSRLRRYVRLQEVAEAARAEFRERVAWWRMRWARVLTATECCLHQHDRRSLAQPYDRVVRRRYQFIDQSRRRFAIPKVRLYGGDGNFCEHEGGAPELRRTSSTECTACKARHAALEPLCLIAHAPFEGFGPIALHEIMTAIEQQ